MFFTHKDASKSLWVAQGNSDSGFLGQSNDGQSKTVPAVAAHRGSLWCLWADFEGQLWYAHTAHEEQFGDRTPFPHRSGLPVVTNLNGHLHAIVVSDSGEMEHSHFNDEEQAWEFLGPLDAVSGAVAHSTPSLVAFHNKLFLMFLRAGKLYYCHTAHTTTVSTPNGEWSAPALVASESQSFDGIPALFVLDGALHVLCGTASDNREILGFKFDYISATWQQCDDVSEGRAARGVSATSYGDAAYLGFIEAGPEDDSHDVYMASYSDGVWQPHEAVAGQRAADPPQIAVLNGHIHCIFNDNTPTKDLRWYSRPVLSYSLSSWMGRIADDTPVSEITVPGTHDSCARSNIPFVRTQYLSITQQLALGIRFFDLRLRRRNDGRLFCYHGGVPIHLPLGLSFESVMSEIWLFLRGPKGDRTPTETVLVSINNDDTGDDQREHPEIFEKAVAVALEKDGAYPDRRPKWFAAGVTPSLGEVRGSAVLLRRYQGAASIQPHLGLDLSQWINNSPNFAIITPTEVEVHLQDKWKYAERIALDELVASKESYVRGMMEQATGAGLGEARADHWYINFCSAVGDPVEHGEIAEAKWIAVGAHSDWVGKWVDGINVRTRRYLQSGEMGRKRLGIVNLDYPELPEDSDLVARLIETNF
ncbi:phosphatidylinositol-specific phospholipase [Thozetella sp. PMI_491]|nr:phosphatidylinositol-specific phospholipase [Thozetella sp. PMI_491]